MSASPDKLLGAGYIAAVLAGDDGLLEAFESAFVPLELLEAVRAHILIMGRRIAVDSDRSLTEVGDAFVAAARMHII